MRQFGKESQVLIPFQGGTVVLCYYGCRNCGNAFWTEHAERALTPGPHPCPHCGLKSEAVTYH